MKIEHEYATILRAIADGEIVQRVRIGVEGVYDDIPVADVMHELLTCEYPTHHYRVKPETIMVNTICVPLPISVAPVYDTPVWVVSFTHMDLVHKLYWRNVPECKSMLDLRICHLAKDSAIQHAKALLNF